MPYSDYYGTKGQGSQEAYDAYYQNYGTSTVWQGVSVDTLGNIASTRGGGDAPFVTTEESIDDRLVSKVQQTDFRLIAVAVVAYFLLN